MSKTVKEKFVRFFNDYQSAASGVGNFFGMNVEYEGSLPETLEKFETLYRLKSFQRERDGERYVEQVYILM